jgi:hypothetical protein
VYNDTHGTGEEAAEIEEKKESTTDGEIAKG